MGRFALILFLFLCPSSARAFCFDQAAQEYGLDPHLLRAIAKTESSLNHTDKPHYNPNGSYDYGVMQINSSWYFWYKSRYGPVAAEAFWQGLADPCFNVRVGAWVYAQGKTAGTTTSTAIARYNTSNKAKGSEYVLKVYRNYRAENPK